MTRCDYFQKNLCRSCSLLEHSAEEIAALRTMVLRELTEKHLHGEPELLPPFSPTGVLPSRAKAKFVVSGTSAAPVLGIFTPATGGQELLSCPLHLPLLNRIGTITAALITEFQLTPYSVEKRSGELKAVIVVSNRDQSEAIVRFVFQSKSLLKRMESVTRMLRERIPEVRVVSVNIQPKHAAILEGPEEITLTTETFIEESLNGVRFCIGAQNFTQVTPETAASLYHYAAEELMRHGARHLLDLYCGIGGFSLTAKSCESSLGVEISESAIRSAREGAAWNSRLNADFQVMDVDHGIPLSAERGYDAVVVNPPRRGLTRKVVEALMKSDAQLIIYSSCSAETLMRDLALFEESFDILSLKPFEMFPLTSHLEVVAVMRRREGTLL